MGLLLSVQQRFILDALRKLGCVRRSQLLLLTREKFRQSDLVISEARMEAMLRQLRHGMGDFRLEGDLVKLSAAPPNVLRLEAIDVMLELTQGAPLEFDARVKTPLLLQFTWGPDTGTARPFTVATLPGPGEPGGSLMERHLRARVVWISDTGSPPDGLALPSKHFFAARLPDGSHRFYGSNGP